MQNGERMTREEAKDFLFDMFNLIGTTAMEYWTEKDAEKMRQAVLTIENESAQPNNDWIPITKKTHPDEEGEYLARIKVEDWQH